MKLWLLLHLSHKCNYYVLLQFSIVYLQMFTRNVKNLISLLCLFKDSCRNDASTETTQELHTPDAETPPTGIDMHRNAPY